MKIVKIILTACLAAAGMLTPAEEKPAMRLARDIFTLKPGEELVLETEAVLPEDWIASQWGLYGYFPNVPKTFPKESGLKIENPKSQWGLVRIVPFRRLPAAKNGKYRLTVPTQRWPEGCYSLVFSGIFLKKPPQGPGKSHSFRRNIYIVIEE